MQLLPLEKPEKKEAVNRGDILYEGDSEEVFAAIIPEYLGGVIYGALCESRASEPVRPRSPRRSRRSSRVLKFPRGGIPIAQSPEVTNLRYLMSVKPGILGKSGYFPRVGFREYFSRRS